MRHPALADAVRWGSHGASSCCTNSGHRDGDDHTGLLMLMNYECPCNDIWNSNAQAVVEYQRSRFLQESHGPKDSKISLAVVFHQINQTNVRGIYTVYVYLEMFSCSIPLPQSILYCLDLELMGEFDKLFQLPSCFPTLQTPPSSPHTLLPISLLQVLFL